MGVNFLLIQRVPSERRTYALQHREHRVENQASLAGGYQIQKQSLTRYRLWAGPQAFVGIRAGASGPRSTSLNNCASPYRQRTRV